MTTENRSSNTKQMVSVPRDEVERLVKLLQYQAHPYPSPHAAFWEGLLDDPAAQHQADGYSARDMADQGAKAFRNGQRAITELTDDLREILGRPNFTCHHIAQALRQMGHTIAKKSEDEQASVIHWMLGHYLKYGPDWRQHASDELKAASQTAE